ncbi:serine/arginine repetitive matrix protein 1-like [Panicum virgatum]|uniref:serine/arginine repetitive matrix protein 1-like n=1 Tax=Panicum virgatum TaxID=38727 RepID=UPI0019D5639B|nr:serine/arginine repetitive matrix protein 1-like [Panicum virgatum]
MAATAAAVISFSLPSAPRGPEPRRCQHHAPSLLHVASTAAVAISFSLHSTPHDLEPHRIRRAPPERRGSAVAGCRAPLPRYRRRSPLPSCRRRGSAVAYPAARRLHAPPPRPRLGTPLHRGAAAPPARGAAPPLCHCGPAREHRSGADPAPLQSRPSCRRREAGGAARGGKQTGPYKSQEEIPLVKNHHPLNAGPTRPDRI